MDEQDRLHRLLAYLQVDAGNVALMRDVAQAAYACERWDCLDDMQLRMKDVNAVDPDVSNLLGLSQMARGRFAEAAETFAQLHAMSADPVIGYNLAYAWAMQGEYAQSLELLTDPVCREVEAAIALRLRCLHHLGRTHEMQSVVDRLGADVQATGMLAAALFDQGDEAGAVALAEQAADTAEGATVLGLAALTQGDERQAAVRFEQALARKPSSARALLGRGLVQLSQHAFPDAALDLDAAATGFGTHAGSWLAAGWAHLLAGDREVARLRFRQAHEVDRGFAEALGALAVTDAYDGRYADAARNADKAVRLDPECRSAVLARALIASSAGNAAQGAALFETLVSQPLGIGLPPIAELIRHRQERDASRPNE